MKVFKPRARQFCFVFIYRLFEDDMMIISSAKVENFEPFGKAFCSQHPFAASPCETQDGSRSKQGAESTNKTVSLIFCFVLL